MILEPIRDLADGSYLAKIYPTPEDRRKDRQGIVVRVIRYTLDDPQRVGHGEVHTLITNLFDEDLDPAEGLIMLYHERWEQELVYDEQKTHQDPPRATKPAHLRSETPAGVIQEVYALALGHFVTRALMFEAATTVGLDTDRLSFLGCLQILKCRLPDVTARRRAGSSSGIGACCGRCSSSAPTMRCGATGSIPGWSSKRCRNIRRNDPSIAACRL